MVEFARAPDGKLDSEFGRGIGCSTGLGEVIALMLKKKGRSRSSGQFVTGQFQAV
ncbi:hypothetical protein [Tritonibacter scottomollicae]|uniref:hypothetical protein n=1 Tax=Tritonibacter scottomollicae TaxID=483013 RepID=UPI0013FE344E|nr:hypothetical protein [Tritonibacter scottomollicae]